MKDTEIKARIQEIKAALRLEVEKQGGQWGDGHCRITVNDEICCEVVQATDRGSRWFRQYGHPNIIVGNTTEIASTRTFRHPKPNTGKDFDYPKIATAIMEYVAKAKAYTVKKAETREAGDAAVALAKRINNDLPGLWLHAGAEYSQYEYTYTGRLQITGTLTCDEQTARRIMAAVQAAMADDTAK